MKPCTISHCWTWDMCKCKECLSGYIRIHINICEDSSKGSKTVLQVTQNNEISSFILR